MSSLIARLDRFVAKRRVLILVAWIAIIAAAFPFFLRQYDNLTDGGWEVPHSQSLAVQQQIKDSFPRGQDGGIIAVLRAEPGASRDARLVAVERLARSTAATDNIALSRPTAARAARDLIRNGIAVVPLNARGSDSELIDSAVSLRGSLHTGDAIDGVKTHLAGKASLWAGLHEISKHNIADAERIGLPLVILILLIVFGSFAAASLQAALAATSVIITGAAIFFISRSIDMSVFSISVASLVGIGVAVDYALFILARYRQERARGAGPDAARQIALTRSGTAVMFSGTTVIVSLASLWLTDSTIMRSIAIGTIIVVAVSVLAAVVLLPAMIALLGERLVQEGPLRRGFSAAWSRMGGMRAGGGEFWERWVDRVVRRPLAVVLVASTILIVLAVPALFINTGDPAISQFPAGHEVRSGATLAAAELGPGATGPIQIVATFDRGNASDPANRAAIAALDSALARDPQILSVRRPQLSGSRALMVATPREAPEGHAQLALVERLRDRTVPQSALARRASVAVGGATAAYTDIVDLVSKNMWRIIAFVLIFSFLTLLVLLRSILLPLKAILMNILSIGAAYGVLVIVFQWDWFDGFLGLRPLGDLNVVALPVVMAVAFGLSMDYEVFLLSRIRERYELHGDNRRAVAEGLAHSARTITSAALIMVCVFTAFAATAVPAIQQIGLGAAVAIALDATLVRLALVPAIMELLGGLNWWLPRRLEQVLPARRVRMPEPSARTSP